jgi:hypothetical protein
MDIMEINMDMMEILKNSRKYFHNFQVISTISIKKYILVGAGD